MMILQTDVPGPTRACVAAMCIKLVPLALVLALGVSTTARDSPPVDPCAPKGEIDRGALELGATVTLIDGIGLTEVPFIAPIPEGDDDELEAEMQGVVSLFVTSTSTGITVDLLSGMIVDMPEAPGQWAWKLHGDRTAVTMMFFNATVEGLSLSEQGSYEAALSLSFNNYIVEEDSFAFPIIVVEN
jgi:hypothetical protein